VDDLGVRIAALVAILAVAAAVGLWLRLTDGRARAVDDGLRLTAEELGAPLATRATMVQFSSPTCGSCASVRRVLSDVAAATPGVGHVEVDAADRLDLARRLSILRTPTVLILGPGGEVVARSSGVPTRSQLSEALSLAGV
jgi:thiol-disulfide isomerase/thioredoxin